VEALMELKLVRADSHVAIVACGTRLSRMDSADDGEPLAALLGKHASSRRVILNLENAVSADSSGIAWLVASTRRFLQSGGKLVVCHVPPAILGVIGELHVEALLSIAADEAAARALVVQ
jgi:hypothetical protein